MELIPSILSGLDGISLKWVILSLLRSSPFWGPIWGLLIYFFRAYFRKMNRARERAEDKAEARLIRIEESLEKILRQLIEGNPVENKKLLEEVVLKQNEQSIEIQAHWEAIKELRRVRIRDIVT